MHTPCNETMHGKEVYRKPPTWRPQLVSARKEALDVVEFANVEPAPVVKYQGDYLAEYECAGTPSGFWMDLVFWTAATGALAGWAVLLVWVCSFMRGG